MSHLFCCVSDPSPVQVSVMSGSAPSGHRDLVGLYLNLCSFSHDNLCRFSTNRSSKTTQMFYLMATGSRVRSQYIENQTRCRCEDLPDVTHVRDAGRRGPGRVHQGPGQEVLHQPGGILEGSTVPEDGRAVWEPDVTFLPRCKCSGGGGLVKIEMAGAGADIANILGRRERYGGCALSLDLGLAARTAAGYLPHQDHTFVSQEQAQIFLL